MSPTLKLCPFCGGAGRIIHDRQPPPLWRGQCKQCGAGLGGSPNETEAITAWNTRADATRIAELETENTHLRAALATSKSPCAYCQLPADEMAKCRSGFPGCARMDDMLGCPEFGAMMALSETKAEAARWREVAGELAGIAERQHEELRMIRMKDCNAVYDTLIRTETQIALARFKQESGE